MSDALLIEELRDEIRVMRAAFKRLRASYERLERFRSGVVAIHNETARFYGVGPYTPEEIEEYMLRKYDSLGEEAGP